jgi:hypothetical protein
MLTSFKILIVCQLKQMFVPFGACRSNLAAAYSIQRLHVTKRTKESPLSIPEYMCG